VPQLYAMWPTKGKGIKGVRASRFAARTKNEIRIRRAGEPSLDSIRSCCDTCAAQACQWAVTRSYCTRNDALETSLARLSDPECSRINASGYPLEAAGYGCPIRVVSASYGILIAMLLGYRRHLLWWNRRQRNAHWALIVTSICHSSDHSSP
jgi:hypothetical protein